MNKNRPSDSEFLTIDKMVHLYCNHLHRNQSGLCPQCQDFLNYAFERLRHCPFGQKKPACKHCQIHCYKQEMRVLAKEIMKYAGPRMLLHHPYLALCHLLSSLRKAKF